MEKYMKNGLAKNGYFYDIESNTLYMTKAFDNKAHHYGSEEYKLVRDLRQKFPDMNTEIRARKTKNDRIPYTKMMEFIKLLPTAEADLKKMERQKKLSLAYKSPYKYMELWFNEKYPYHAEYLVKNDEGEIVWDVAKGIVGTEVSKKADNITSMFQKPEEQEVGA